MASGAAAWMLRMPLLMPVLHSLEKLLLEKVAGHIDGRRGRNLTGAEDGIPVRHDLAG